MAEHVSNSEHHIQLQNTNVWVIQSGKQQNGLHRNKNSGVGQVLSRSWKLLVPFWKIRSQSPQGYAILNIKDLLMTTDQPLRHWY